MVSYLSVYDPVYLHLCLFVYKSVCIYVRLYIFVCVCVCLFMYLYVYQSASVYLHLSVCTSDYVFACVSVSLCTGLSICRFVCLYASLSLFLCLALSLSLSLYASWSVGQPSTTWYFNKKSLSMDLSGTPTASTSKGFERVKYVKEPFPKQFWWIHVIGLIWTSEFILACQQFVIAGAVANWFFRVLVYLGLSYPFYSYSF